MRQLSNVLGAVVAVSGAFLAPGAMAQEQMAVPADYRQWVFLTSSLDLNYSTALAPDHHILDNVFVDPVSYQAFLKTGTWPDKTTLVLEIRMTEPAGIPSKNGQIQTGVRSVEIHIKDEARFPSRWAFFASSDGKAAGKLMPQSAPCYSCHQDHGAVDTTFVQFYPTLLPLARDKGTLSAGYLKDISAK